MAVLGTGVINITPKFPGLSGAIQSELSKYDGTASGSKAGEQYSGGFKKSAGSGLMRSGAVVGAFSSITTAAMGAISSHIDSAVSRFDTLNNYPVVMQNLGYSAGQADESLSKMDEHLQGLPTAINDMASTVQGITAVTNDLDLATDASLALNDMLLASGSSTQLTNAAMEQFRQILAKGKPDMQDWKSLTSAMPGQMNQLAEAMLGAGATSNDLYTALGGGGAKARASTEQLLNAMVKLDTEGSGSISSFADQAKTATGGVATSMANVGTAVTRGIAKVMDAVGKDTFSGLATDVTSAINGVSGAVAGFVSDAMPTVKQVASLVAKMAPALAATGAAFAVMSKGGNAALMALGSAANKAGDSLAVLYGANRIRGMNALTASVTATGSAMSSAARAGASKLGTALSSLATPANLVTLGVTAVTAAVSVGLTMWNDYQERVQTAAKATDGMADAVSRAGALEGYSATLQNVGSSAGESAMSVAELNESIAESVDAMNANTEQAESTIATLNTAQGIIDEYAGKTDLSTDAQGRLEWAIAQVNDQLGLSIDAQDVANNKYTDADGKVQSLTKSIDDLVASKKQEAKVTAITSNLTEAYSNQSDAANTYRESLEKLKAFQEAHPDDTAWTIAEGEEYKQLADAVNGAKDAYDSANSSVAEYEKQLGDASSATAGSVSSVTDLVSAFSGVDDAMSIMVDSGVDIDAFAKKLGDAGLKADDLKSVTTEDFKAMADSCGGDVGRMVQTLALYNAASIVDKSGKVDLNDASLVDAQGNVYTWNGSELVDKSGKAVADDTDLIDAQGNVWTWNKTKLKQKNGKATIDTKSLDKGKGKVDDWEAGGSHLTDKKGTVTITGIINGATNAVKKFFNWNAAGGIRPHASGGIRYHADGAIATSAVPLDVVGEDGAEAIVPLTNKRYSAPFARVLAEQMQQAGGKAQTIVNMTVNCPQNMDVNDVVDAIQRGLRDVAA